jgi:hypothetical protein
MNLLVSLFFLHTVFATLALGLKFFNREDRVFRLFGIALLFDAAAFAAWGYGLIVSPENLLVLVTVGAVAFLVSLVFFYYVSIFRASAGSRTLLLGVAVAAVLAIFYIGRYIDPASAFISPEGLLFFNLTPLVQMLYLFALAFATIPAIDMIATKFKNPYAALLRYGLIAEIVGGIMLITSRDEQVLYLTGWVIGLVYVALWGTLLLNKKAWPSGN